MSFQMKDEIKEKNNPKKNLNGSKNSHGLNLFAFHFKKFQIHLYSSTKKHVNVAKVHVLNN